MKRFHALYKFELKRILRRNNIILFIVLGILAIYFVYDGVNEYNRILNNKIKFQRIETERVQKYTNYTQYGGYGFRLLFLPSPINILFSNSNLNNDVNAYINSADIFRIYHSYKGKNLFFDKTGFADLGGLFLLLGTILALYFGYDSIKSKEFLRFQINIIGIKTYFFCSLLARSVFLLFYLSIIALVTLLILVANNLFLTGPEIINFLVYFLFTLLLLVIFQIVGFIAACSRRKIFGILAMFLFWLIFVFIFPETVRKIIYVKADAIESQFDHELKKLGVVMDFEARALDQAQRYTNLKEKKESERVLIESYWNNEVKKILSLENKLRDDMKTNLEFFHRLSVFSPTTFYGNLSNEISSKGYQNFFSFFDYIQDLKTKFIRYYFNKKFYSNYSEVESFIKDDENIFYAESRLPGNFRTGVTVNLIYLVLLLGFAYYRFFQFIYGVPDIRMPQLTALEPEMRARNMMGIITEEERVISQFYRVWSGKFGKFDNIAMVGEDNVIDPKYKGKGYPFLYVCHANQLPYDIKTIDFVRFLWGIQGASARERAELYMALELENCENAKLGDLQRGIRAKILLGLALLKKTKCVMMNDIGFGMTLNFLEYFRDSIYDMRKKDVAMLYLSQDVHTVYKMCEYGALLQSDRAIAKQVEGETDLLKFELGEPHPKAPR